MQILENEVLTIEVSGHGAELQSIRKGSVEYLWQGDPTYWGRRSPVLFPIVGSVWEKRFRVDGQEYELGQHGFARDMDFSLVHHTGNEVRYRLESTDETMSKFPYPFILEIAYRLDGNKLDVEVKHPLEVPADGLLPIASDTFDAIDTIMLEGSQIDQVGMFRVDGTPWIKMTFDAPVVGIWSPPGKVSPFICLEPWYGRCDRAEYEGDFTQKDWMNRLAPGESFHSIYTIEIC
jgi:galactose mutarotase-like enzyme